MNDPAILFYTSDFLTGILTMTNEQVGKYIKLLCLQHQKFPKHLTEKDMLNICITYDEDIFEKFTKNEDGKFYNKRMEDEILKRKAYSESRRVNRMSKKSKKKPIKKTSKTYVPHMEDEIENENVIKNKDEKPKSLHTVLMDIFLEFYYRKKGLEYDWAAKDGANLKYLIDKLKRKCKEEDRLPELFQFILEKNNDKWINDNLSISIINSKFNEIIAKIKSERSLESQIEDYYG